MHWRIRLHLFCPLAKRVQLLSLGAVGFNVRITHQMVISHDEEQDRPFKPLGLIEFELRDGELGGIAFRAQRRLPILAADDSNVGSRVLDHLEGGIDHIDIRFCRVVFHCDIGKPLAFDGFDQRRPVLLQVREGARDHDAEVLARSGMVVLRHSGPMKEKAPMDVQESRDAAANALRTHWSLAYPRGCRC